MSRWLKRFAIAMLVVVGVPAAVLAGQFALIYYDEHRVRSMCARLLPGTPLSAARRIIADAGVAHLLPPETGPEAFGSYDNHAKDYFFSIPVAMQMGDQRCAIFNDGRVVLKAEMEWL